MITVKTYYFSLTYCHILLQSLGTSNWKHISSKIISSGCDFTHNQLWDCGFYWISEPKFSQNFPIWNYLGSCNGVQSPAWHMKPYQWHWWQLFYLIFINLLSAAIALLAILKLKFLEQCKNWFWVKYHCNDMVIYTSSQSLQ